MIGQPVTEIPDPRGGRNRIRRGDVVRVLPSTPGKRDGITAARFVRALVDDLGTVLEVDVTDPRNGATRTFYPHRIARRAQTRHGETIR